MLPTGHIRGLDGLRALAILWVILWHTETSMGFPESQLGPLLPLVEILPVQMLSLALAARNGREAGRFERATKITTAE